MVGMVQQIDMDAWLDRAEREFKAAFDACLDPNVNTAIHNISTALLKYYPDVVETCRAKYRVDEQTLARVLALFLANYAPLIYSLRIELVASQGTAGITEDGDLFFFTLPFIDRNYKNNPIHGVKPDDYYDGSSVLSEIAYVHGRKQHEFDEMLEKSLAARDYGEDKLGGYVSDIDLWPDDVPYFDPALVAAYLTHEISHLGFSHFGQSAKIFQKYLTNYIRFSPLSLAAKLRTMIKNKNHLIMNLASQIKLDDDNLKKLVSDSLTRSVVLNISNIVFDSVIHTVLPAIELIITSALKKRMIIMSGEGGEGGGGGSIEVPVGEVGDDVQEQDENGGGGTGGDNQVCKRRVVQQGQPQRKYQMRSTELQDRILDNLKDMTKSIGKGTTDLVERIRSSILSLREDPLKRLNAARSAMEALFGSPFVKSKSPRADEVHLRRAGKIGYLPRQVRKPVQRRVMVVVDTSGSMTDAEISAAFGFIRATLLKHNYLFTLYVCDAKPYLVGIDKHTLPDLVEVPRGGTALGEAIRDAKARGILSKYDSFVFITDGYNNDWAEDEILSSCEQPKVMVILTNKTSEEYVRPLVKRVGAEVIFLSDIVVQDLCGV